MVSVIHGSRIRLRPIEPRDVTRMLEWDEDDEITRYINKRFPSPDSWEEWFGQVKSRRRRLALAIDTVKGEFIGDIQLEQICWRSGAAELRICIGEKRYWSRGYGAEAIKVLLDYAFDRLGLKSVYLRVYRSNHRAIRCYEKVGFVKEGILRAGSRAREGFEDLVLMVARRQAIRAKESGPAGESGERELDSA